VSFEQAAGVFRDSEALTIHDRKHSGEEDRWITLGLDAEGRLLVVCHTWREDETGARCRIISARKASINESKHYRGKQT